MMSNVRRCRKGSRWIDSQHFRPEATIRLFCFSYAGGTSAIYRPWQTSIHPDIEVCPVVLPGRASRFNESPFDYMEPLIHAAAKGLLTLLDKPFAFFGYSLGALIAFELARFLQLVHKLNATQLFVAGRSAPHVPYSHRPIHSLPELDFVTELRRLGGTPEELLENREAMRVLIPSIRADFALAETYKYVAGPGLSCPIMAIGGQQDVETGENELKGWEIHTQGSFSMRMFPGNHFFLLDLNQQILELVGTTLASWFGVQSTDSAAARIQTRFES